MGRATATITLRLFVHRIEKRDISATAGQIGRLRHTWLRATETELKPLNIGLSSAVYSEWSLSRVLISLSQAIEPVGGLPH